MSFDAFASVSLTTTGFTKALRKAEFTLLISLATSCTLATGRGRGFTSTDSYLFFKVVSSTASSFFASLLVGSSTTFERVADCYRLTALWLIVDCGLFVLP